MYGFQCGKKEYDSPAGYRDNVEASCMASPYTCMQFCSLYPAHFTLTCSAETSSDVNSVIAKVVFCQRLSYSTLIHVQFYGHILYRICGLDILSFPLPLCIVYYSASVLLHYSWPR